MSELGIATDLDTSLLLTRVRLGPHGPIGHVEIRGGRIVSISASPPTDRPDEIFDAGGRTLLPGLTDAHVHLVQWASARRRVDLSGAASAREAADLMAQAARRAPGPGAGEALIGFGFRDALWPDAPHRDLLAWAQDRAVALVSNDLHTAWLGPAALAALGRSGHPTGVLRENEALDAAAQLASTGRALTDAWIGDALRAAAARGVTRLIDFEYADNVTDWARRGAEEELPVRVTCTVYPDHLERAIADGLRTGSVLPGTAGRVDVGPLKLFVDGSLNTRTALCHDPYPGTGGEVPDRGVLLTPPDELQRTMARAAAHGLQSAVHAIGDRANAIALGAFERVGCPGRIEHAQLIDPADLPRFARPDLVVGVQPAHAPDDRDVADHHWGGRTHRAYPYADLLKAGATLEFGSDAPVTPLDPWHGVAAAVHRGGDAERPPWHPEQRIGLDDALLATGAGPGGLQVGRTADLIVTEENPADVAPQELAAMPVHATLLAGRWTHRAD
ncbi:amidohydrolase [Streptomyces triticagri]|uniref:Amidohydrolase n=1 Tax=Streptomyces triticagri TaxID=2293568 RepID=A0A372M7S0_9ACTN|nr:amidohydrolase [Streptomyces triticagri]RFU86998.1 amidohydrolase [Streptomyces triticagri]